jgi:hypothetical protein
LFEGPDAASNAGEWLVAWRNKNDEAHDLSHLSVYAPAALWLLGSGLLGLVAVARRKNHT